MSQPITTEVAAFNGTVAAAALTTRSAKNCTVVRTGAGAFTVTLTGPAITDPHQLLFLISPQHTAELLYTANPTADDTVALLFEINDGTATDPARFAFKVERIDNALQ